MPISIETSGLIYCNTTTLTASPGFTSYQWSLWNDTTFANTGDTTQSIAVSSGGLYRVTATNALSCPSNAEITVPDPAQPYEGQQICMVLTDDATSKNNILIEKTLNVGIDSVIVYRMNNLTSQYTRLGAFGIDSPGLFVDESAIPSQQSYQYRVAVKDSCGGESSLSNPHKTILLQASQGVNNEINLSWNLYEGFSYPNFEIYRRTDANDYALLATVPNNVNSFVDLNPPSANCRYKVCIVKDPPCDPSKLVSRVSSNGISTLFNGTPEHYPDVCSIFPNPANTEVTLRIRADLVGSGFELSDVSGRIVLSGTLKQEISRLNISELSSGNYILKIQGKEMYRYRLIKLNKF